MIGRVISHYRVLEELGQGGMGVVFKAEDVRLGRTVALKFISEKFTGDAVARKRFDREARTASALNHPNICTIHDIGEFEGRPFIAMELLLGQSLKDVLSSRVLSAEELLTIGEQIADALMAAHERKIVHRDIKPGNVVMVESGRLKVLDFGLARHTSSGGDDEATGSDVTVTGTSVGTVAYMSPEQALGKPIDHRSDLFSLGVLMYEMANRHRPFKGDTAVATLDRLLHFNPPPLAQVSPQHPPVLSHIVQKLMAKNVQRRYQSAKELLADLRRAQATLAAAASAHAPLGADGRATRPSKDAYAATTILPSGPAPRRPSGPPSLADAPAIGFKTPLAPKRDATRSVGSSVSVTHTASSAPRRPPPRVSTAESIARLAPEPRRGPRFGWMAASAAVLMAAAGWAVWAGVVQVPGLTFGRDASPPAVGAAGQVDGGVLEVTSAPGGARVTIDGQMYGTTPLTVEALPVGEHSVLLESDAGSLRRTVHIEAGQTTTVAESIYAGWVAIFAPVQLEIRESGRSIGTTEDGRIMLAAGPHELELVNQRLAYRVPLTIDIPPGEVVAHSVELPAIGVAITAEPWAEVSIDGEPVGRTPLTDVQVLIGTRQVLFVHPEHGEQRATITVSLDAPPDVHMDMTR